MFYIKEGNFTNKYIKKTVSDENGIATLDFIIGTHYHYDHIGAFNAVISDSSIKIKKAENSLPFVVE